MIRAFSNEFISVFQTYISSYCEAIMKGEKRRNVGHQIEEKKNMVFAYLLVILSIKWNSQKSEQRK